MHITPQIRFSRFINPTLLINQNKTNEINEYLSKHTLHQFYECIKNFDQQKWIFCTNKQMFQFCIISTYKTHVKKQFLNYSTQHYKQMLKILQKKYFHCLHALLQTVHQDFPLYSQFIQLMFKYMLEDDEKLTDCIAQICSKDCYKTILNYEQFLEKIDKMIKYCNNKQLKNKFNDKIRKRIVRIINNQEDKLPIYLFPFKNPYAFMYQ